MLNIFLLLLLLNLAFNCMANDLDNQTRSYNNHHHHHQHNRQHTNIHPKILNGNTNITTYEGDTVILPCEIANLEKNHVIWFKMGNDGIPSTLTVGIEQFSRNMRYRVIRINDPNDSSNIESWNFEIRKVNKDDEGLYQCNVKYNQKYKININVYLEVLSEKDKPINNEDIFPFLTDLNDNPKSDFLKTISKDVETVEAPIYSLIKLKCNELPNNGPLRSSIRNIHDIQWYKDGLIIEPDIRRLKKSSSFNKYPYELEFYTSNTKDSGIYQCKRNSKVLKNIFLHVYDNKSNINSIKLFTIMYSQLILIYFKIFI